MSEKPAAGAPPKSSARPLLSIVVLVLIAGFVGYGFYERTRLIAAQEQEKKAIAVIREIKGATMESDAKDWRQFFVPDQQEAAIRIGTVTVPIMGEGPDYTKKVVDQLRTFDMCEQLYLADGPLEHAERGGAGGAPAPKAEVKEEDVPAPALELLEVAVIRKEFPQLKIVGEETAAKDAAAKLKAKEEAAARKKEAAAKKEESAETQAAPAEGGEKKADDGAAEAPSDTPADKPAEPGEKKDP